MPEKKRQHYVPRFILRNFSHDDRSISLMVLSSGQRIDHAGIRSQCKHDYFYGKQEGIENAFQKQEGLVSRILKNLNPSELENKNEEELAAIITFIHYQNFRTLSSTKMIQNFINTMMKPLLKKQVSLNPAISQDDLEKAKIGLGNPQIFLLKQAYETLPVILDLEIKFIVTDKPPGFVISDNPVVAYNQFVEHHKALKKYTSITGLAAKGLQFYMPISPNICIALYDPTTYRYGSNTSRICKLGQRDKKILNWMQGINALKCLYFDPNIIEQKQLEEIRKKHIDHPDVREALLAMSSPVPRGGGTYSQLMMLETPSIRIGAKMSFIQVIEKEPYRGYNLGCSPVRPGAPERCINRRIR